MHSNLLALLASDFNFLKSELCTQFPYFNKSKMTAIERWHHYLYTTKEGEETTLPVKP